MTVRIIGGGQKILGTLQLPASTRLVDLKPCAVLAPIVWR